MPISERVQRLIQEWLSLDTNPTTRKEILDLAEADNEKELEKRLGQRLTFGTAGLRGRMQAGYSCMNDLTVTQASQGLCMYLKDNYPNIQKAGICVGWDGRHHSKAWAILTAKTFVSKGIPVYLFSKLTATPLVPYVVLLKGCAAGVMVTASHNPKDDNGYKVYWSNGCQIIPPVDVDIQKAIEANSVPWKDVPSQEELEKSPLLFDPTTEVMSKYPQEISSKYCHYKDKNGSYPEYPITFTPMHGVGKEWMALAFASFNIPPYIAVPQQIEADPEFPTVPFPNPEEGKGALALAVATAEQHKSTLVIANDPDSDRLAVAERQPSGDWRIFTGNETGILLGAWVWSQYQRAHPQVQPASCVVLTTTVSSQMLGAMAKAEGLYYEETLTGFKWLGSKADQLKKEGKTFLFAFEEAIGFMVGDTCLDKDGIRGGAVLAEMALHLHSQNSSVLLYLTSLYQKYGYFETKNRYFFCYDPQVMVQIFSDIRNQGHYPTTIGAYKVVNVRDLATGYDSSTPDKKATLPVFSSNYMITFYFENGGTITLRGSGTEPKLKYYAELNGAFSDKDNISKTLADMVDSVIRQVLQPEKYSLVPPKD